MFKDPSHRKYFKYVGLGAEIAIALSVPILLGYWLDLKWDSSPGMLLAGVILGMLLMIGVFLRVIRDMNNQ